jgi:hypothetical protein
VELEESDIHFGSANVTRIVFPTFVPGSRASATTMTSGETALLLFNHVVNFAAHEESAVAAIASLAKSVAACRLDYSDAFAAVDVLNEFVT